MEEDYKVRYEDIHKGYKATEWMNKQKSKKFFERLKNEKELKTIWAELIYSPIDENEDSDEQIIDDFERKIVEILGYKMIVPN